MKIESKTVSDPASPEEVFKYVSNLNNFKNLLPQDRISEWESRDDYCSFKVQGTATIDLHLKNSKEFSELYLESGERSPFPIKLTVFLSENETGTKAYQFMEAQINPFLKMMVEKPLANLFDYIADRLVDQFNK
jgi:carbon monoxide dehydrogenase subunit G